MSAEFGSTNTLKATSQSSVLPSGGDATKQLNLDVDTPISKQLEDLHKLITEINVAMMTTRTSDGHLVSRAMSVRECGKCGDTVFVTNNQTGKMTDFTDDPHVALSFYREKTKEWVSISGTARVENDRALITRYWTPELQEWFGKLDDTHDGGPADPRMSLVYVTADSVHYQIQDKSSLAVAYEMIKSGITGAIPKIAAIREISTAELTQARKTSLESQIPGSTKTTTEE
ncbi:hypothetical protein SmJEL517_g04847 [Synchytrium microbalum]|uniref:General stress protein FMN-binding split barrel domain-containing protein n=1 Tax=Synchytrium microbalum TaxID=1806994 RepID=A0A507BPV5_9FUNG|nr:uncharacterized protein SmJEL517_g04847 [Synchytrium microbalum]TPX31950.1 hypothetical protein SmJEL517_g04847 [Synchytrium microbalum]